LLLVPALLPGTWAAEPGVLRIEMEVAGAALSLVADGFRELPAAEPDGERRFVADRVRALFTGTQAASYRLLAGEGAEDWISRHEVQVRLDQRDESRRGEEGGPDPVVVRVGAPGDGPPWIRIEAETPVPVGAGGTWRTESTGNVVRSESAQVRLLREGVAEEGAPTVEESRVRPRFRIRIGSASVAPPVGLRHGWSRPPEFVFEDGEPRSVAVLRGKRVAAGGETETWSRGTIPPGVNGGFGDVPVKVRWNFRWGGAPDIGWFGLADGEASSRPPDPDWPARGSRRDVSIHLERPEEAEAIRVTLHDVSAWPGVAVNAREALLAGAKGWADLREAVPVSFEDGEFRLHWERRHVSVRPLPEDRAPDLYFAAGDHPAFGVEVGNGGERAGSMVSRDIRPLTVVRVRAADWGAAGSVGVEVQSDGVWEELEPRGPGADAERLRLVLPDDSPQGAAAAADEDGDGLTAAEEFRGVVVQGTHRRLSPEVREVFVLDPDRCLGEEERIVLGRLFAPWRVELLFLGEGEHHAEKIGERVPVLVLEPFGSRLGGKLESLADAAAQRAALRATRPRPGIRTLFVEGPVDSVALAGDFARALGLDEWGAQP
jgi:hypothetical protein